MSTSTGIAWTDATWNPWMGCDPVSPGCDHCYMFRDQRRYGQDPEKVRRSKTTFREPLKWRKPWRVFTCSWSDFFHADADPWREEAWDIIRRTPHLTYQVLTKRPSRIARHLPADWGEGYPNVWLGVSVETQEWAGRRIPLLLQTPAAKRFVSAEPLLGLVDFTQVWHTPDHMMNALVDRGPGHPALDWIIVGGESGEPHRAMEPEWLAEIVEDCRLASVPVFVKQDSGPLPGKQGRIPDTLFIQEFPR